ERNRSVARAEGGACLRERVCRDDGARGGSSPVSADHEDRAYGELLQDDIGIRARPFEREVLDTVQTSNGIVVRERDVDAAGDRHAVAEDPGSGASASTTAAPTATTTSGGDDDDALVPAVDLVRVAADAIEADRLSPVRRQRERDPLPRVARDAVRGG